MTKPTYDDDLLESMHKIARDAMPPEERGGLKLRLGDEGTERVLLLPEDTDAALATRVRLALQNRLGSVREGTAPVDPAYPDKDQRQALFIVGAPFEKALAKKKAS